MSGDFLMVMSKNILIAVHNGIIALDIKKQLIESGYNAEIVNPYNQDKIKEDLSLPFQLIIFEKSLRLGEIMEAAKLAKKIKLPAIYLSTDMEIEKYEHPGLRVLRMPFDKDELQKNVRIALGENEKDNPSFD